MFDVASVERRLPVAERSVGMEFVQVLLQEETIIGRFTNLTVGVLKNMTVILIGYGAKQQNSLSWVK